MEKRILGFGLVAILGVTLVACGSDDDSAPAPTPVPTFTSTPVPPTVTPTPMSAAAQACLDSGGTITTGLCCIGAPDFPNLCGIGACGCGPTASEEKPRCDCGEGRCFDGETCVERGAG